MYENEISAFADAAKAKAEMLEKTPFCYLMAAVLAGFFITVATILSHVTSAVFYPISPEIAKFLGAFLFPIAIILIVFIGGELFTGNNMTMAMGMFEKKITLTQSVKVWLASYIGNFIGAFILSGLFVLSGCCRDSLIDYYTVIIPAKLELDPLALFIRGILCNFLVCLAVFAGKKMASESGKIIVMFCVIATFVIAGFEHCIANMSSFTIAAFLLGSLPADKVFMSLLMVTLGNMIGGIFLFSLPLKFISGKRKTG